MICYLNFLKDFIQLIINKKSQKSQDQDPDSTKTEKLQYQHPDQDREITRPTSQITRPRLQNSGLKTKTSILRPHYCYKVSIAIDDDVVKEAQCVCAVGQKAECTLQTCCVFVVCCYSSYTQEDFRNRTNVHAAAANVLSHKTLWGHTS